MWTDQVIVLNEIAANGASVAQNGLGMRNIELQLALTGFTGTIKFVGSNADIAPNFGSAASKDNPWDYVKCIDLNDGSAVNGGTGVTGSVTSSVRQLEMNVNIMKWYGAIISGYSGGTLSLKAKSFNESIN